MKPCNISETERFVFWFVLMRLEWYVTTYKEYVNVYAYSYDRVNRDATSRTLRLSSNGSFQGSSQVLSSVPDALQEVLAEQALRCFLRSLQHSQYFLQGTSQRSSPPKESNRGMAEAGKVVASRKLARTRRIMLKIGDDSTVASAALTCLICFFRNLL